MAAGRQEVKYFAVLGDSLSDRGTLWGRKFLGLFPIMRAWSGLEGRSPNERFTNGYVWLDYLAIKLTEDFEKQKQATQSSELYFDDDERIAWQGYDLIRSFAAGGVASHKFIFTPCTTFIGFMTRITLDTLETMRKLLLEDDEEKNKLKYHKDHTLIIEWTGANDLVTVNEKPTIEAADLAVKARIKNIKRLIEQGYKNFLLFDLPELNLTPRFKALPKEEQDNAQACIYHFNNLITEKVNNLSKLFPHCQIEVYRVSEKFNKICSNPEKYGMDKAKLQQPFVTSNDFVPPVQGEEFTAAPGYVFYDDIHPTTAAHKILADKVYNGINKRYRVVDPRLKERHDCVHMTAEKKFIDAFKQKYNKRMSKDRIQFFGALEQSKIAHRFNDVEFSLADIFDHALNDNGKRSYEILQKLQWLDDRGQLKLTTVPVLKDAFDKAMAAKVNAKLGM